METKTIVKCMKNQIAIKFCYIHMPYIFII